MRHKHTPSRPGIWYAPTDSTSTVTTLLFLSDEQWQWTLGVSPLSQVCDSNDSWVNELGRRNAEENESYFSSKSSLQLPTEMFTLMEGD